MDLYSKKDGSLPQKVILTLLELIILTISYWILFCGGYNIIFSLQAHAKDNETRHLIIFIFNIIVFLRIGITMFYLIKRHIPWEEALSIPFAFAIYYIGFALLGYKTKLHFDGVDFIAIVIFITGSFLNTGSELMRDKWKGQEENKNKLYTKGLFKYSMHINYFGDILWVTAYAIITRNWYSCLVPVYLALFFIFYNIPKLDRHLKAKYGQQFNEYRAGTKRLIPFVY